MHSPATTSSDVTRDDPVGAGTDADSGADPAVLAQAITKRYGDRAALADVSLRVPAGSVLALLGPNGAGKTTLVRVLTTLIRPDSGRALVAGHDVVADPRSVRRAIGLVGQHAAIDEYLTGRENLTLVARLLRLERTALTGLVEFALETFGLLDVADDLAGTYSGGMRRRLDLAVTLLTRPAVVFLDEPTTGLDPASRRDLWAIVDQLAASGTAVVLTTQYLEEADRLADTVAVLDRGRVIGAGTPEELKARLHGDALHIRLAHPHELAAGAQVLADLGEITVTDPAQGSLEVRVRDGAGVLPDAIRRLDRRGLTATAAEVHRPGLDDVFLALTGQRAAPTETDHRRTSRSGGHSHHGRRQS